ncbi:hypothetical protein GCM10009133_14790 [Cocleimonas flava]|uniref:Polyhydroxyalkanoic acid system protein n=1 Tax=Cocleimonas flava TaxID=634765 RepID=A0A4R1F0T7_9GAMM|nr:hypothetical protein [Cocleimonas flava]TCJ87847.1 hypothetical protein EV695_2363 [Cocleimonas flava]
MDKKQYEMAFSVPEFTKTLRGQFITEEDNFLCNDVSATQWTINTKDGLLDVSIDIEQAPPRVIAMLSLPVLNVGFSFRETSEEQQAKFLKRFFKYFHKGGG